MSKKVFRSLEWNCSEIQVTQRCCFLPIKPEKISMILVFSDFIAEFQLVIEYKTMIKQLMKITGGKLLELYNQVEGNYILWWMQANISGKQIHTKMKLLKFEEYHNQLGQDKMHVLDKNACVNKCLSDHLFNI